MVSFRVKKAWATPRLVSFRVFSPAEEGNGRAKAADVRLGNYKFYIFRRHVFLLLMVSILKFFLNFSIQKLAVHV